MPASVNIERPRPARTNSHPDRQPARGPGNEPLRSFAEQAQTDGPDGFDEIVALDGSDLNAPQRIGPERLRLGIGQRFDLSFVMPARGAVRIVHTRGQGVLFN